MAKYTVKRYAPAFVDNNPEWYEEHDIEHLEDIYNIPWIKERVTECDKGEDRIFIEKAGPGWFSNNSVNKFVLCIKYDNNEIWCLAIIRDKVEYERRIYLNKLDEESLEHDMKILRAAQEEAFKNNEPEYQAARQQEELANIVRQVNSENV